MKYLPYALLCTICIAIPGTAIVNDMLKKNLFIKNQTLEREFQCLFSKGSYVYPTEKVISVDLGDVDNIFTNETTQFNNQKNLPHINGIAKSINEGWAL